MQATITIPDPLIPTIQTWMSGQVSADGQFQKYADVSDLVQQNLNDGLLGYFVGLYLAPQVAALQSQIDALKASVALPPAKPAVPVVVVKP